MAVRDDALRASAPADVSGSDYRRLLHERASKGDARAVETLVLKYQGLARSMALRIQRPSDELDDLIQVANYGLLKAIERFDVDRGFEFSTFAFATMEGELKRHRRNTAWAVRVPRRVQERYLHVAAAVDELSHERGRQPTIQEIADRVGVSDTDVIEVLDSSHLQRPTSLDAAVGDDEHGRDLPSSEQGYEAVEIDNLVDHLLDKLGDRERLVVRMRFYDELTQSEIAEKLGISQMHVSRLLRKSLERLRALATDS